MEFVNNGFRQWCFQRPVVLPIEIHRIDGAAGLLTVQRRMPPVAGYKLVAEGIDDDPAVIVNQALAVTVLRTVKTIAVAKILSGGEKKDVPHVAGTIFFRIDDEFVADGLSSPIRLVIDDQCCLGGVAGEKKQFTQQECAAESRGNPQALESD